MRPVGVSLAMIDQVRATPSALDAVDNPSCKRVNASIVRGRRSRCHPGPCLASPCPGLVPGTPRACKLRRGRDGIGPQAHPSRCFHCGHNSASRRLGISPDHYGCARCGEHTLWPRDRIRGSSCMRVDDDGARDVLSMPAPEMRSAGGPGAAVSTGAGGGSSGYLAWLAARPPSVSAGPGCSEVAHDKSLRLVN